MESTTTHRLRRWLDETRGDLVLGARMQRKAPATTAALVLTLALGVAATSLAFTVTNSLFLSPLPVAEPERLVRIYSGVSSMGTNAFTSSYPDFLDVAREREIFSGVVAEQPVPYSFALSGTGERARIIWGDLVSAGYFSTLGVRPAVGRFFSGGEDRERGTAPTVVVSHRLWREALGARRDLAGATVVLDGHPVRVVGVVPERFHGTLPGFVPDVWVPAVVGEQLYPVADNWLENREARYFFVAGRLRPGVTVARARAALDVLARRLRQEYPRANAGLRFTVMSEAESRVHPMFARQIFGASSIALAVALLVLLTACANAAGVLLVRASARRREIGVRLALGATRGRLVRQLVTEHATLSLGAGLVGLAAAFGGTRVLEAIRIPVNLPLGMDFPVDGRVLAFGLVLTVVTGILFGVAPAWAAAQADPAAMVKDGDVMEAPRQSRLRSTFVAAQAALSVLLLIGGGLFLRSLQNAQRMDVGFRPEGAVMTSIDLGLQGYSVPRAHDFFRKLSDRVAAVPEVRSSSLASHVPFQLLLIVTWLAPEGFTAPADGSWPEAQMSVVDERYFETMRIPLVAGREFDARDAAGAPRVVILNELLARQFWPDGRAVGRRVHDRRGTSYEVVGVARQGKYLTLGEPPKPYVYFPLRQSPLTRAVTIVARGEGDPTALLRRIGEEVHALDPAVPLYDVKTLAGHVGVAQAPARSSAAALGIISLVALALTALGLYGTVGQVVARRTYEIGIRRALGARDGDVARLVVRDAARLVLIGTACGAVLAVGAGRVLRGLLYGVAAFDPVAVGLAVLVLMAVCVAAAWVPTWRAIRVEATTALRYQ